jgi:hypothetical protein
VAGVAAVAGTAGAVVGRAGGGALAHASATVLAASTTSDGKRRLGTS